MANQPGSSSVLPTHPNQANVLRMASLALIKSTTLDMPDDYGEDLHPFLYEDHVYNLLWTSMGDRKLLVLNLKTGKQDGFDFHMKQRSVKSIIRKFRPLHTSFINQKPGLVIIEYFYDSYRSCSLNRANLDFERRECRILDEIHEFPKTNFCQIDFVQNDPRLLMHYETQGKDKGYVIYEIIGGTTNNPTLKHWMRFHYESAPLGSPWIQDDYLCARKPPNSTYIRHLREEKSMTLANPKPSFYTDCIGAVPADEGLKIYFLIRGNQPRFTDVGLIVWNNDFKLIPHRNVFTIPSGWWRSFGIFDGSMVLVNQAEEDGGYTYYSLSMKDPQVAWI